MSAATPKRSGANALALPVANAQTGEITPDGQLAASAIPTSDLVGVVAMQGAMDALAERMPGITVEQARYAAQITGSENVEDLFDSE